MTLEDRLAVLAERAADWQDPDYEPRQTAVESMLGGDERYTEEGLAFAVNHAMHQLGGDEARGWIGTGALPTPRTVGVSPAVDAPLGGLTDAAAALVLGHRVILESPTPLVSAFIDDLAQSLGSDALAAPRDFLIGEADAWLVTLGTDETEATALAACALPEPQCFVRSIEQRVAVLSGDETHDILSGLAEDLLLHEGIMPSTPRIVWAPAGTPPDALLNALAGFRELFPAHPDTDGTLSLPTAFLVASKQPHATGPGFLLSLGAPEAQAPGHIRWVEYDELRTVRAWIEAQQNQPIRLVAKTSIAEQLRVPAYAPGDTHRPTLDPDVPAFLGGV